MLTEGLYSCTVLHCMWGQSCAHSWCHTHLEHSRTQLKLMNCSCIVPRCKYGLIVPAGSNQGNTALRHVSQHIIIVPVIKRFLGYCSNYCVTFSSSSHSYSLTSKYLSLIKAVTFLNLKFQVAGKSFPQENLKAACTVAYFGWWKLHSLVMCTNCQLISNLLVILYFICQEANQTTRCSSLVWLHQPYSMFYTLVDEVVEAAINDIIGKLVSSRVQGQINQQISYKAAHTHPLGKLY